MAALSPADAGPGHGEDPFADQRRRMADDIRRMGVTDPRVLDAMARVPRHRFVPKAQWPFAYADGPLPIGNGQTISQPYMVAAMTEALRLTGTERVLEVGTGSGYQCAVLAELAREVVTVERIAGLSERAGAILDDLGYTNVIRVVGDGTLGAPEHAPYDAVVVTAGAPAAPEPLLTQLADGGRLVIPEGGRGIQTLVRYTREGRNLRTEPLMQCMFVPLIGRHGWAGD
jgi:protein-L-isoaspartate(D-aspartate) O-methyltransferase